MDVSESLSYAGIRADPAIILIRFRGSSLRPANSTDHP
jgi:hypothetical protein